MGQLYVQTLTGAFTADDLGKVITDNDGNQAVVAGLISATCVWLRVYTPPTRWQRLRAWWKRRNVAVAHGIACAMFGGFVTYNGLRYGVSGVLVVLAAYALVYGYVYGIGRKK